MSEFKRILVAVDFSPVSARALQLALDLAEQLGVRIDVVHSVPITAIDLPAESSAEYNEELIEHELDASREKLARFVKEHANNSVDIGEHISYGEPARKINEMAETIHSDLIVIGTHGRTGLSHLLMGSVAESVLRHANIPVLCIRSHS
ncbi:MAG: universal stress protein [Gammaproteobacteria bacterium]